MLLESAGGVAVPLLDESGGGVVEGLVESAGGVLDIELEDESAGAAGAVVDVSAGALGEVDCCFEHATIASALMHNKRRLRFIDHLTVCRGQTAPAPSQCRVGHNVPSQDPFHCNTTAGKPEVTAVGRLDRYFFAATRFFFFAGSFGRDLPNDPW